MKNLNITVVIFACFFCSIVAANDGGVVDYIQGEGTVLRNLSKDTQTIEDLNSELMNRTNQPMAVRSLNTTQPAFDTSLEKDNTLVIAYSPLATTKIRVREFMSTLIILPENDAIKTYKLADSINFIFQPLGDDGLTMLNELPNAGTVEVNIAGADTSLHIVGTSGNVYTFYVRGDTWDSPFSPTLKVIIKDDNLNAKLDAEKRRAEKKAEVEKRQAASIINSTTTNINKTQPDPDYLEEVAFNPEDLNFGYRLIGGNESIRPFMVFDDGKFTYFRFAKSASVSDVKSFPAVYRVADGSDVPTNTSPIGSMLRVEGVDNKWTLRLGESYLCIERMEYIPDISSSMNSVIE